MRLQLTSEIHPEYLRSLPTSPDGAMEVPRGRNRVLILLGVTTGLFLIWTSITLRLELKELQVQKSAHQEETTKIFKEYDALHQAIVEKLKRHSELLKGVEPNGREEPNGLNTHGVVTVPKANVRGTPATNADVVMTVPMGSRLLIEEILGDWFKVMTPLGTAGYLSKDVFKEAP